MRPSSMRLCGGFAIVTTATAPSFSKCTVVMGVSFIFTAAAWRHPTLSACRTHERYDNIESKCTLLAIMICRLCVAIGEEVLADPIGASAGVIFKRSANCGPVIGVDRLDLR